MNPIVRFNLHPSQIKELIASKVSRTLEQFHYCDQHDCKDHGNWADGLEGDVEGGLRGSLGTGFSGEKKSAVIAKRAENKSSPESKYRTVAGGSRYDRTPVNIGELEWSKKPLTSDHLYVIKKLLNNEVIVHKDGRVMVPPAFNKDTRGNFQSKTLHMGYRSHAFQIGDLLYADNAAELKNLLKNVDPMMTDEPRDPSMIGRGTNPYRMYDMGSDKFLLGVAIDPGSNRMTTLWPTFPTKGFGDNQRGELRDLVNEWRREKGLPPPEYEVITTEEYARRRSSGSSGSTSTSAPKTSTVSAPSSAPSWMTPSQQREYESRKTDEGKANYIAQVQAENRERDRNRRR